MAAAPPGRFAGCRDLVDMLERLPDELDAAIMEHAGGLTQFLLGRLPQPMSRRTITLLWTEAIIADNVAAVRLLPQLEETPYDILAHSEKMVAALTKLDILCQTLVVSLADPRFDLTKINDLVDLCPETGPLLLPFFFQILPQWKSNINQIMLISVGAAAAGDLDLFAEAFECTPIPERWRLLDRICRPCVSVACRLGHKDVVREMLEKHVFHRFLSVHSAILSNDVELLEMVVSRSSRWSTTEHEVKCALRLDHNEIAVRLMVHLVQRHYCQAEDILALCIDECNLDVLRSIATSAALRSDRVYAKVPQAAGAGRLEILKYVYETSGEALWAEEALTSAIEGGWVDVARWLLEEPCKQMNEASVIQAFSAGSVALFDMLVEIRADLTMGGIMDAAARIGNLTLVRHMHNRGFSCTTAAMDGAAQNRHTDVVRFLHDNRTEGCTRAGLVYALNNLDDGVLQILHAGPVSGTVEEALHSVSCHLSAHAARELHRGVDCHTCDCSFLLQAIEKRSSDTAMALAELGHAVSDDAAKQLARWGDLDCIRALSPQFGASQWKGLHQAATESAEQKLIAWIDAEISRDVLDPRM
ncbi:hypothetical protein HK105_206426 [Polyrhizophydium stewartii]|uniref:Ankyrin repeat protein n=1 Tax=Polyrhizophydium stewartii TaxID=2732419 RepID=A0ABR4N370_9FUNG